MASRDPGRLRGRRSLTDRLLAGEGLSDLLPVAVPQDATAVHSEGPSRPPIRVGIEAGRLAGAAGAAVPEPALRLGRAVLPPPPAPADATRVEVGTPVAPAEPDRIARAAPHALEIARKQEEGRRSLQERYDAIPAPVRLLGSAAVGVGEAATLGKLDDLASAANRGIASLAGIDAPVSSDAIRRTVDRSALEHAAELGGFVYSAGSLIGMQNRALGRLGGRLQGESLTARLLRSFDPATEVSRGTAAAQGALEGLPFDLAYEANTNAERLRNVGIGLPAGALLGPAFRKAAQRPALARVPEEVQTGLPEPVEGRLADALAPTPLGAEAGAISPSVLSSVAGVGVGAATGAALDDENRMRGALVGAGVGGGAVASVGRLRGMGREGAAGVAMPPIEAERPGRLLGPRAMAEAASLSRQPTASVNPDEFVNVGKFALDPAGETRLREEVSRVVQAEGLTPKQPVPWSQTRRDAARIAVDLGLDPESIDDARRLSGAEMLAIRNIVRQNIEQIGQTSRTLADATASVEARASAERTMSALEAQNDALLSRFIRARTETGRDLNNLKILAQNSMEPVTWLAKAQRLAGGDRLPEAVRSEIVRLINEGDRASLVQYVARLRKATAGEKISTLWKAGLLTGPPTHIANVIGNTTMAALETAKDAPAAMFDSLLSIASGSRTKTFDLPGAVGASLRGARAGADEALRVMQGVPLEEALRKYDYFREVNFDNAFLDGYTKFVFRSLGAMDRVFRGIALHRSLDEQARVVARAEGRRGEDFTQRVAELAVNPTDEMALRAIEAAEIATFTNQGALGRMAQSVKRSARQSSDALGLASEVVMPFTMTPANVATRVLEYSPLGALSTIPDVVAFFRSASNGKPGLDTQRHIVERLGRSSIGSTPIVAGWLLAEAGLMNAGYPASQSERGHWQLTGEQENSVLIGDRWYSVERLSPVGNLMVLGAHLHGVAQNASLTASERAAAGAAGIGKTLTEQSFLSGVQGALDAVGDPERTAGRYLSNTAASVVPNIAGRAARAIDPVQRDAQGPLEQVQSRIPLASRALPARVDQLGDEQDRARGVVPNLFDPFYTSQDRTQSDPIRAEIDRVGAGVTGRRQKPAESREEYQERLRIEGAVLREELEDLVRSTDYRRVPEQVQADLGDERRTEEIDRIAREIQREMLEERIARTRSRLTRDYPRIMETVRGRLTAPVR